MAAATNPNVAETPPSSTSPLAASVVPHPWSQVVRGNPDGDSSCALPPSSAPSPPPHFPISLRESSDPLVEDGVTSSSEADRAMKTDWKRLLNESVESGPAVIGGVTSWPALSESSKPTYKSPLIPSNGPRHTAPAPPSGPGSSNSSPKRDLNPSAIPELQKSMERGGGSSDGAPSCGSATLPSPPPISAHIPETNADKKTPEKPVPQRQTTNITTSSNHGSRGGRSGSQTHDSGDHRRSYGGNGRWNSGGGFGIHFNNYANHRDQEHVNYNGFRRNAGGRDIHMQHRGAWSNYRPTPQPAVPVCPVYHPQFPTFGYPIVYPDVQYPFYYVANQPHPGNMPYSHQPPVAPPMSIPNFDVQRSRSSLLKQIEFYFSADNLCRDIYLRKNMDEQGWVPASLIAGFNRVKKITNSVEFILDTMRSSTDVEVKGDKMRKRHNWKQYILPPSPHRVGNISSCSPAVTLNSSHQAVRMKTVELEGVSNSGSPGIVSPNEAVFNRSVSLNLSYSPATLNSGHQAAQMKTVELEGASNSGSLGVASQNEAVFSRSVSLNPSCSPTMLNSGHQATRMKAVELEGSSDSGSPGVTSQNEVVFSGLVSLNPSS